jgi:hypothetical protein
MAIGLHKTEIHIVPSAAPLRKQLAARKTVLTTTSALWVVPILVRMGLPTMRAIHCALANIPCSHAINMASSRTGATACQDRRISN